MRSRIDILWIGFLDEERIDNLSVCLFVCYVIQFHSVCGLISFNSSVMSFNFVKFVVWFHSVCQFVVRRHVQTRGVIHDDSQHPRVGVWDPRSRDCGVIGEIVRSSDMLRSLDVCGLACASDGLVNVESHATTRRLLTWLECVELPPSDAQTTHAT